MVVRSWSLPTTTNQGTKASQSKKTEACPITFPCLNTGLSENRIYSTWLAVLTILKHISQWKELSHILWKIKAMFETTNHIITYPISWPFNREPDDSPNREKKLSFQHLTIHHHTIELFHGFHGSVPENASTSPTLQVILRKARRRRRPRVARSAVPVVPRFRRTRRQRLGRSRALGAVAVTTVPVLTLLVAGAASTTCKVTRPR